MMENIPETESTQVQTPEPKKARRVASLCGFATVVAIAISTAFSAVFSILLKESWENGNLSMILGSIAIDLIAMPLAWFLLLRRIPRDDAPEIAQKAPLNVKKLLLYFPCAFALMFIGSYAGGLIGALLGKDLADVPSDAISAVNPWLTLVCVVFIGPVAEELFFRKAMIDRLTAYHPVDAILLSALLFGLIHGNLTQFLYVFPFGILLGIVYYYTRNIGYTIVLHMMANAVGGLFPQLINTVFEGSTAAETAYIMFCVALSVAGIVLMIVNSRKYLPIRTEKPRHAKPFYLNAGFIVACIVCIGLFLLVEFGKTA